jgi:hypothetical protein
MGSNRKNENTANPIAAKLVTGKQEGTELLLVCRHHPEPHLYDSRNRVGSAPGKCCWVLWMHRTHQHVG